MPVRTIISILFIQSLSFIIMKKLFFTLMLTCITCLSFVACGGSSWNRDRANELAEIPLDQLTKENFDEMLSQLTAGLEIIKNIPVTEGDLPEEMKPDNEALADLLGKMQQASFMKKKIGLTDDQLAEFDKIMRNIQDILQEKMQEMKEQRK